MHLLGKTLWKVAPCLCESAIMVVTCRLDTDKDRRVVGLRGGRVESSVWLGKGREKLSHVYTVSLWINQTKHWKVLGWVGLGEVVESAIMVVTYTLTIRLLSRRALQLELSAKQGSMRRSFTRHRCPPTYVHLHRTKWHHTVYMITLCFATYALNRFLSPARNCVSLRTRGHSYQLSEYSTDPHKKFFLIRSLYSSVK